MGGMGGPGNPMGFGKSKAQIQMVPDTGVTFDDVAGCDGAKLELAEGRFVKCFRYFSTCVTRHSSSNLCYT